MKCLIFYGSHPSEAGSDYNEWAKNKPLAKDVIIHTHTTRTPEEGCGNLMIVVFFDEKIHLSW